MIHTRLDYVFCSDEMISKVANTEYLGRTLSDHSPLKVTIKWGAGCPQVPNWRLRPEALLDSLFKVEIKTQIQNYFEANEGTASNKLIE